MGRIFDIFCVAFMSIGEHLVTICLLLVLTGYSYRFLSFRVCKPRCFELNLTLKLLLLFVKGLPPLDGTVCFAVSRLSFRLINSKLILPCCVGAL